MPKHNQPSEEYLQYDLAESKIKIANMLYTQLICVVNRMVSLFLSLYSQALDVMHLFLLQT